MASMSTSKWKSRLQPGGYSYSHSNPLQETMSHSVLLWRKCSWFLPSVHTYITNYMVSHPKR